MKNYLEEKDEIKHRHDDSIDQKWYYKIDNNKYKIVKLPLLKQIGKIIEILNDKQIDTDVIYKKGRDNKFYKVFQS